MIERIVYDQVETYLDQKKLFINFSLGLEVAKALLVKLNTLLNHWVFPDITYLFFLILS